MDESQSNEFSNVFANPDGTWTSETATEPINTIAPDGDVEAIQTDLTDDSSRLTPENALNSVSFSGGGDRQLASIELDGHHLTWWWPTVLPTPVVDGSRATYRGVLPDGDLVVYATPAGFGYGAVLTSPPKTDLVISTRVVTDGEDLTSSANGGLVIGDDGQADSISAPAQMWDNSDNDGDAPNLRHVQTTVQQNSAGNGAIVALHPDLEYLKDPDTTYPVVIDPVLTLTPSADAYVASTGQTVDNDDLLVGTSDSGITKYRSYLKFNAGSVWMGKQIVLSTLALRNYFASSCTSSPIRVSRINETWGLPNLTWSNQPAVSPTVYTDYSPAKGFSSACPAADGNWNVTAAVQSWADGAITNYGFRVAATSETSNASWRRYRSSNYDVESTIPRLITTYNSYPTLASDLSLSPSALGYTNSTTPKMSLKVHDPDGGQVRGHFAIFNSSGTAIYNVFSPYVANNGTASVTVPNGILANGGTYLFSSAANDGNADSKDLSVLSSIQVDNVSPTVQVSSSTTPSGSWQAAPPSSNQFSLHGSPDTKFFSVLLDGLSQPTIAASGGNATLNWVPPAGAHTLVTTPVDKAGNVGAAVLYYFGYGSPAFNYPTENSGSAGAIPVSFSGPPGAASATLEWRFKGSSTWNSTENVLNSSGSAWSGNVTATSASSLTGGLTWDPKAQHDPAASPAGLITAPALIELRGCMSYSGAPAACTTARTVQLLANAFSSQLPVEGVGPATIALYTGAISVDVTDAAGSEVGLARNFSSMDDVSVKSGLFGPGWSNPLFLTGDLASVAEVIDRRAQDGTFLIVDPSSGSDTFVADPNVQGRFLSLTPASGASLTLAPVSGGVGATLTLTHPSVSGDSATTWRLKASDTGADPTWVLEKVDSPGQTVDVDVTNDFQRPVWVRESDPSASATCNPSVQTEGCRALLITYTGTGSSTRVATVSRQYGAATQSLVTTKLLVTYSYAAGLLSSACTAAPSPGVAALCDQYAYSSLNGRTLLTSLQPPGQAAWRFYYDATGRVTFVKRAKPTGGDASWTINYGLTVATAGLPDMSQVAVNSWGQQTAPSRVVGVTRPVSGTATTSNMDLYYTAADGTLTNTAMWGPNGWLVNTVWLDDRGNAVRELSGTGWALAMAQSDLAQKQKVAEDQSTFTAYNTYGSADYVGTVPVDEYGPAHTAKLKNGVLGFFRTHVHTIYDTDPSAPPELLTGRPSSTDDPEVPVKLVRSVSDASRLTDFDPLVTTYRYDPVMSGDASGWDFGAPTVVSTQIDANTWSTIVKRYDSEGRVIEQRSPGAQVNGQNAAVDALTNVRSFYTAAGTGDCGNKPEWVGRLCKSGPADASAPTTFVTNYNRDGMPTSSQELVNGQVVRTSTTTVDNLNRPISVSQVTAGQSVSNGTSTTTYTYDIAQGYVAGVTNSSGTVTSDKDNWGRVTSYTDLYGQASTTAYDDFGEVASSSSGGRTYSYNRDARGFLSNVNVSGVGTFSYGYNQSGNLDTMTYPNGMTAKQGYDEAGVPTQLSYVSSTGAAVATFSAQIDTFGRDITVSSPGAQKDYGYDTLGRLVSVRSYGLAGCSSTFLTLNSASNRTKSELASPDPDTGSCRDPGSGVAQTYNYDSAGRDQNPGYAYDALGRTTSIPAVDAAAGSSYGVAAAYNADSTVASLTQLTSAGVSVARNYVTDPVGRTASIATTSNGAETGRVRYRYDTGEDSPNVVETSTDGGASWQSTAYIVVPDAGMVAEVVNGVVTFEVNDRNGSTVGTTGSAAGASLTTYAEPSEFGESSGGQARYGWLGAVQRSQDAVGGLMLMGARVYNPRTGAFLTPDPVPGGNRTPYGYPEDPVNTNDASGMYSVGCDDKTQPNCKTMYNDCRQDTGIEQCLRLFYLLHYLVSYSDDAIDDPDPEDNFANAGRHFGFVVLTELYLSGYWAFHVIFDHENGSPDLKDKRRDIANNLYTIGWYHRHHKYARSLVGHYISKKDMRTLFWHGADLYQRAYMYGLCGKARKLTRGVCNINV